LEILLTFLITTIFLLLPIVAKKTLLWALAIWLLQIMTPLCRNFIFEIGSRLKVLSYWLAAGLS